MKRTKFCVVIIIAAICAITLCGCSSNDGVKYNNKMKNAYEYSFDLVYTTSEYNEPIYVSCFMNNGDYAYRFSLVEFNFSKLAYRQIYTKQGTFYEICEMQNSLVWTGEYRVTYNVKSDDDCNFIYKYTQMITTGSYATLLTKPEKITYRNMACKQYNFTYEDMDLTYVFGEEDGLLLKFIMVKDGDVKQLEYYNYKFENVETECIYPPTTFGLNNGHVGAYVQTDKLTYEYLIS